MQHQEKLVRHTIEIGGKILELEVGRFAEQANAAVLGRYGDTMILATVVSGGPREDLDYFPLWVEYQEKLYAGGRIKGSRWVKREGRPSDDAILNARLIDRSIRPLFPENFTAETQVILTVLSVDAENDPDILGIITTSAALAISDIPWEGPIAALRIGFVPKGKNNSTQAPQMAQQENSETQAITTTAKEHQTKAGDFMINPTYLEREYSDLDLVVSATEDAVIMVEAGANEIPEPTLTNAFAVAQSEIKRIIEEIRKLVGIVGKKKQAIPEKKQDPEVVKAVAKQSKELVKTLTEPGEGQQGEQNFAALAQAIMEEEPKLNKSEVKQELLRLVKQKTRQTILGTGKRPDGRKTTEIRPITGEVGILPRTHGSAMFKRGATQTLTITTLAAPSLEQWIETMEGEGTKRYMHHYYMPPFSVGEVGRLGWPSRREIGHGALAERALEPMIPQEEDFPYTIRVVSEILSSNGSTSMASVCGSTLSLMDAGVPLKKPVAGIAMGLVYEGDKEKKGHCAILSDIQGIEDNIGDMDFKVAGTRDGITAIQMDVKIKGVTTNLLAEVLEQARQGRLFILEKMLAILPAPRAQLSKYAPRVEVLKIATEQIGDVIGPGGKMIRQIIAETGASVDVEDDGAVTISGTDPEGIKKAVRWIEGLTRKVQVGEEFEGVVKRIQPFGAFIEILPGKEGLVHVSKMSQEYVSDPNQLVSIGDKLKVKVAEIDELGRINLSIPGIERKPNFTSPKENWQRPHGHQYGKPPFRSHRR